MLLLIPNSFGDTVSNDTVTKSKPNISGAVTIPEKSSKEPINVFSIAGGKNTEIKNNDVLVLPNKDMRVKITGYIEGGQRGDKISVLILRPDDSVYTTGAYLNEHRFFTVQDKIHTKWVEGCYEILANYMDKDEGKIKFFVTDKSVGADADSKSCRDVLSVIFKYLQGKLAKDDLISHLKENGWSEDRIDSFLDNNPPKQIIDYTLYPIIVGSMLALLYVLASYLGRGKINLKSGASLGS